MRIYVAGSWTVVEALDELGWHFALGVRDVVRASPFEGLVFDLSAVTSVDHSALAMLARVYRINRSLGGAVHLVVPQRNAGALSRLSRVYDLPPAFATIAEATS